jgi:heme/copper-type cytochrome/quinol oxidase subunit 2
MVTLLLAVVAIAARGRPLGSRAGSGGALPFSFWDYVYTTIVIVVVPLFIAGLIAAAMVRRQQRKPRNSWQSLLRMLVLYCAFLGLELLLIRHLHLRPRPIPHAPQTQTGLQKPGQTAPHHHGAATEKHSLAFRWDELAIVLGLLVVVAAIVVVRLRRRDQRSASETAPEVLAAALDESLDDLRTDPDLRATGDSPGRRRGPSASSGDTARVPRARAPLPPHERRRRPQAHRSLRMG